MTDSPRPGSLTARLSASPTVLVVEDEADIAEFLGAYFRASGFGLVHLDPSSADEVAAALATHQPDLVLLDLHLRGLAGLDVYRRIRADQAHALLPVIIVTADSRPAVKEEALAGGVDGFVTKPFNVKALFGMVQEKVAAARRRAEVTATPATGDTVTGTGTHTYIQDRLADEIGVAAHSGSPVTLALVKTLSLRDVNRRLGPAAGDRLLREVARRLIDALPQPHAIGRNAGSELAVVLPGVGAGAARTLFERVLAAASAPVDVPGVGTAETRLAVGLATYPDHGGDRDEVFMAADVALAEARERDAALSVAR